MDMYKAYAWICTHAWLGELARTASWSATFTLDGSPGIFPSPLHYEDHAFADLSSAAADTLGHSTISSFTASESSCQLLSVLSFPSGFGGVARTSEQALSKANPELFYCRTIHYDSAQRGSLGLAVPENLSATKIGSGSVLACMGR